MTHVILKNGDLKIVLIVGRQNSLDGFPMNSTNESLQVRTLATGVRAQYEEIIIK